MPILLAILIVFLGMQFVGWYFASLIVYPRTSSIEASYQREVEGGKLAEVEFAALPRQELSVRSPFGYSLYGIYIPIEGSLKTVIIVHGIRDTLYGGVKYLNMFRARGFNVLLYEQRNHGRSGKKNTTFGYYEKYDLKAVMDWAMAQTAPGGVVGTMGESLGAAVVLQHSALDQRVAFVIADCPYSDLTELLKFRMKMDFHLLPFPLLNLADFFCWLTTGMTFSKVSPIRDVARGEKPVFWIHGQNDTYIPPHMSVDMYHAKTHGVKKLFLAPNAGHAQAYWNNREEYDRQVGEFLSEAGFAYREEDVNRQMQAQGQVRVGRSDVIQA